MPLSERTVDRLRHGKEMWQMAEVGLELNMSVTLLHIGRMT